MKVVIMLLWTNLFSLILLHQSVHIIKKLLLLPSSLLLLYVAQDYAATNVLCWQLSR